jgi:hypothetical protein
MGFREAGNYLGAPMKMMRYDMSAHVEFRVLPVKDRPYLMSMMRSKAKPVRLSRPRRCRSHYWKHLPRLKYGWKATESVG